MKRIVLFIVLIISSTHVSSQSYFPPNSSADWETIDPASLDYCQNNIDSLYNFLEANNTKAFIMLKDGKIVLENYFNGHSDTSNWYWASAGKTLVSFLVGIAQEEGKLNINDATSAYLSEAWTNVDSSQEAIITIKNQLSMTSGLDDEVDDPYCTLDSCLIYLADAGTRWAYHNGPYTLLRNVLENATEQGINNYAYQKVINPIGMNGLFVYEGYNNLFLSTARSMARFGLLMLNNGQWNQNKILSDSIYFNDMISPSQDFNESYGYLWWLNGKPSFMLPQSQYVFDGGLITNAPNDMYSAMGKNGQYINVIPSQKIVWIRMGEMPQEELVPTNFNNDIWGYINELVCESSAVEEVNSKNKKLLRITDVLGKPSELISNSTLFFIYDDGSIEKKIILD